QSQPEGAADRMILPRRSSRDPKRGTELLASPSFVESRSGTTQASEPLRHRHAEPIGFAPECHPLVFRDSNLHMSVAFGRSLAFRDARLGRGSCHSRPNFTGFGRRMAQLACHANVIT